MNLTKGIINLTGWQPIYRKWKAPVTIFKELFVDLNLKNYRKAVSFNWIHML